jgi:hypothetical protein
MDAWLSIIFFTGAVFLGIVALSWLVVTCLMPERYAGRNDVSYAVGVGGALFLYTFSTLVAKQALIEHTYNIVMPLIFALVPSFAAGLGTFVLRMYSRQFRKRG